jgi:hypothetical protein
LNREKQEWQSNEKIRGGNPVKAETWPAGRSALGIDFLKISSATLDRGRGILENMAQDEPARFAELCGRLIPKDVSLTISERLPGGLDADDWQLTMEILQATRQALPDASERKPGEVLSFVLEAIRAHNAKAIDSK